VAAVHGVAKSRTRLSDFTFTFHFHALEKEMATHSSIPSPLGLTSLPSSSLQSHKRTAQTVWARCLSGLSRHLSRIPQLTPLKRRVLATAFPLSVLGQASASCQFPPLHLSCESCGQKQSKITLFCRPAATVSKPSQAHCTAWLSLPKFPCSISLFSCPRWKLPTNSSFLTPPSRS